MLFLIMTYFVIIDRFIIHHEAVAREMILFSGKAKIRAERKFTSVNDRLSIFSPKVGTAKRLRMGEKWLSCNGLTHES